MDSVLAEFPYAQAFLDDVIIGGSDMEDCANKVQLVLQKFRRINLKIKRSKCQFFLKTVEYLGHSVGPEGVIPLEKHKEAIQAFKRPENTTQLRSFLGLLNYYHSYIPNLSDKQLPLNELLRKNVRWTWKEEHIAAFKELKDTLNKVVPLKVFDPDLQVVLIVDASPYGVGDQLCNRTEDGKLLTVAFASATLSSAESLYPHYEKEALSLIFAVKKFHRYLYGRVFTVLTDSLPVSLIFNEHKEIPISAHPRLVRWALFLSGYHY
jgi:hypothetical protein